MNSDVRRYVLIYTFTHSALLQIHTHKFPHTAAMQVTCKGEKWAVCSERAELSMCLCVGVCVCARRFSGLQRVIRPGNFSQREENGKELNDMRKK